MDENKGHENATANQNEGQMFTQAQLDSIVNKRLEQERAKFGDYADLKAKAEKLDKIEEANKSELQKANERATALQAKLEALEKENEIRGIRDEVAKEMKIPTDLLTADTKEGCEAQAKSLLAFASAQQGYPTLKDSGEVNHAGEASTREQFARYVNNLI